MPLYEVSQVIASGFTQHLVCEVLGLPTATEEVKQIRKTVIIDNCKVIWDKVIIDGRLRKDILMKAASAGFPGPGITQACSGVTGVVAGPVVDLDVDIAFSLFLPAPGAQPGDKCVVLQAFVEGEKEEAAAIQPNGTFLALVDKSVVFICVKVVRDVVTGCPCGPQDGGHGYPGPKHEGFEGHEHEFEHAEEGRRPRFLCPPARSTGVALGGVDGIIPAPTPGPLADTWVGPTLIFAGVLNPGIPNFVPPTTPPPGAFGAAGAAAGAGGFAGAAAGAGGLAGAAAGVTPVAGAGGVAAAGTVGGACLGVLPPGCYGSFPASTNGGFSFA